MMPHVNAPYRQPNVQVQTINELRDRIARLESHVATLQQQVRERTDSALAVRIARAIAKAKPYLHPGVNAGDHKVLSEVVSILEGKGG